MAASPLAAQDADLDALRLADAAPDEVPGPSDWRRFVELGLGAASSAVATPGATAACPWTSSTTTP
jgi:hypothetical protein